MTKFMSSVKETPSNWKKNYIRCFSYSETIWCSNILSHVLISRSRWKEPIETFHKLNKEVHI